MRTEPTRAARRGSGERPPRRRLTRRQKCLAAVAAALAVALAGVLAWKSLFVQPELPAAKDPDSPAGPAAVDYGDGVQPHVGGERKSEHWYTVLILGRDTGGGGNTDTMLLASYDVTNQKAAVMSIPRDTLVNIPQDVKKINAVYNYGGGGEQGLQALYREISQLVGFEPDFRVVVEWEAVGALVDAIGGVDFDVPYAMDYHDPAQDLVIEQAPGLRTLTGGDAMQVIRWRCNDNDSPYGHRKQDGGIGDSGRMELQQSFLKAVLRQAMKPENVLKIGPIAQVFQENVETDLSFQNILWFGKAAVTGGLRVEDVDFFTMPWRGAEVYSRTESKRLGRYVELAYVTPAARELLDLVNTRLSPFAETFTLSDLDIMSVNADGSLRSSTGRVEDPQAALPPPKEPQPDPDAAAEPPETDTVPAEDPGTDPPPEADPPADTPATEPAPSEPPDAPDGGDGGTAPPPDEDGGGIDPAAPEDPDFIVMDPAPAE